MGKFTNWTIHFSENQPYAKWKDEHRLTTEERSAITKSIQIFQKGESSEAKNLIAKAEEFVADNSDKSYLTALKAFIREENRHADELAKFMELHQIPKLKEHWQDNLFRAMRKQGKLEGSVTVLLTAEIMASVFYDALHACTRSNLLKQLCTNILTDEDKHIAFQSLGLAQFYEKRNFLSRQLSHAFRALLLAGSVVLVWFLHRRIFRKSNYSFGEFFRGSFAIFERTVHIIEWECAKDRVQIPKLPPSPLKGEHGLRALELT